MEITEIYKFCIFLFLNSTFWHNEETCLYEIQHQVEMG